MLPPSALFTVDSFPLGKKLLKKTSWLNEEVNRTEASPSVSVPWRYAIDTAMLPATGVQFVVHFVAKSPQVRRQRRLENHRKKFLKNWKTLLFTTATKTAVL